MNMQYPGSTIHRAIRAVSCSPFTINLLTAMCSQGVSPQDIAADSGIQLRYTRKAISERMAEKELLWLAQVGLVRREVDGQGLTNCFRLTPLGRQLIQQWHQPDEQWPTASVSDRLQEMCNRWFRVPV